MTEEGDAAADMVVVLGFLVRGTVGYSASYYSSSMSEWIS